MKIPFSPIRLAKIPVTDKIFCWRGFGKISTLHTSLVKFKSIELLPKAI